MNTGLLRKFNKLFKEENGKVRDWLRHEEKDIHDIWKTAKDTIEALFPLFKYIEIDYSCFQAATAGNDSFFTEMSGRENRAATAMPTSNQRVSAPMDRRNTVNNGRLLSEQQINKAKDRFADDAQNALREALMA